MQALALDLGASSGKIISGIFDGKMLKVKEMHRFVNHPYESNGHIYWNFPEIYKSLIEGLRKAAAEKFTSFGVDSFSNDYGLIDESGKLLSPYTLTGMYVPSGFRKTWMAFTRPWIFTNGQATREPDLIHLSNSWRRKSYKTARF